MQVRLRIQARGQAADRSIYQTRSRRRLVRLVAAPMGDHASEQAVLSNPGVNSELHRLGAPKYVCSALLCHHACPRASAHRAAPDSPSRFAESDFSIEVYGFVLWIGSMLAWAAYIIYAFFPEHTLHHFGVTYYPSKYVEGFHDCGSRSLICMG